MPTLLAIVRTSFIARHCWPEAPARVAYLRDPHRHTFSVEAAVRQDHNDRAVEYIMLREDLDQFIGETMEGRDLGRMSCEMMAETIRSWLIGQGLVVDYVRVFEDGENGAEVR